MENYQYSMRVIFCCNKRMCKWVDMLKNGQINVTDEELLGCPSPLTTAEMADQLQIIHGSTSKLICERLHFHKVCAVWVPEQVMNWCRHSWLNICNHFWMSIIRNLSHIFTGDETWICHCEAESKHQSIEWKHLKSNVKKFRSQPEVGELCPYCSSVHRDQSMSISGKCVWL